MSLTKTKFQKLFFAVVFLLSCFTMNSDNLGGYMQNKSTVFIFVRYILIIVFVCIAAYINKNNSSFVSKFAPVAVCVATAACVFDYYVTKFSGSQFLYTVWWIASVFIAQAALFTVFTAVKISDYKRFYRNFWLGFIPMYIFILFLCFAREPFSVERTVNIIPFQGTFLMLKAFIKNPQVSFEAPLIFFGNLVIFIPLPFVIKRILEKASAFLIGVIGFVAPILIESYQYLFYCGDADVDDLILNWAGFAVGFVLYSILMNKKRFYL